MNTYTIDNVPAEFQQAWHYANGFMYDTIDTLELCVEFVNSAYWWSQEEKDFLIEAWELITGKGQ